MTRNPTTTARHPDDSTQKAQTILVIEDWILWDWNDPEQHPWGIPYAMFHRCGVEGHHGVNKMYTGEYACSRCVANPPDELIAVYELMTWDNENA